MENKKGQGYVYAIIMGLLTTIICLAIADGLIGVQEPYRTLKIWETDIIHLLFQPAIPQVDIFSGSD